MKAIEDIRNALRIARAASFGGGRGQPRIDRADKALADLAELIRTTEVIITRDATVIAGDICIPMPGSNIEAREALNAARAALARCQGGVA